jgi:hypothetical protein
MGGGGVTENKMERPNSYSKTGPGRIAYTCGSSEVEEETLHFIFCIVLDRLTVASNLSRLSSSGM